MGQAQAQLSNYQRPKWNPTFWLRGVSSVSPTLLPNCWFLWIHSFISPLCYVKWMNEWMNEDKRKANDGDYHNHHQHHYHHHHDSSLDLPSFFQPLEENVTQRTWGPHAFQQPVASSQWNPITLQVYSSINHESPPQNGNKSPHHQLPPTYLR